MFPFAPVGRWSVDGKTWHSAGGFPSGQRGQTVNLMAMPSQVRILHSPLHEQVSDVHRGWGAAEYGFVTVGAIYREESEDDLAGVARR